VSEPVEDRERAWLERDGAGWLPPTIDATTPSVARIYDYLIGGKDHFAVDREAAERLQAAIPQAAQVARANRAFVLEAAGAMARAGVTQFLDLGSGIPSSPSVHEVVRGVHPEARVVYVDNDPVVMAHNRALLATDDRTLTVAHDLRAPASVLNDPGVRQVLDLSRPVGLLMVAVLHFVDLSLAPAIVDRYLRSLAPGSQVAITAVCRDGMSPQAVRAAQAVYATSSAPLTSRTRSEIEALFEGLTLVDEGLRVINRAGDGGSVVGGIGVKTA